MNAESSKDYLVIQSGSVKISAITEYSWIEPQEINRFKTFKVCWASGNRGNSVYTHIKRRVLKRVGMGVALGAPHPKTGNLSSKVAYKRIWPRYQIQNPSKTF